MSYKIDERSIINEKNIFGQNTNKGNNVLEWNSKKDEHKIKIFFTSPCHGGVDIHYVRATLELQALLQRHKIPVTFHLIQSSIVTQGRNLCTSAFLKSECTHMLFVDTDVEFDETSVLTMLKADKDIVLTPYPMKVIDWEKAKDISEKSGRHISKCGYYYPMAFVDPENIDCKDGITEIKRGPAGFMLIKRQVFEKMSKEYPHLKIKQQTMLNQQMRETENFWNFWDTEFNQEKGTFMGEDFAFCKRWTAIGGRIYANVDAYITHHGDYSYKGRFIDEGQKIK